MVNKKKFYERINQSKWTKLYILLACLQGVTIIALQTAIAYYNTAQVDEELLDTPNASVYNLGVPVDLTSAIDRLKRIKWENIAFIGFQVWFVGMSFDATLNQNAAEVIALAFLNLACAVLGALEVVDGKRWLNTLSSVDPDHNIFTSVEPLRIAYYLEIALSICVGLYAIVFAYLSYAVVREFGWVIYKKIGADISIQRMYRTFQFFVLGLKINIFIEFLVSAFYLIQFALKQGFKDWTTNVFIVITVLILPLLYFGRTAVSSESTFKMCIFMMFQMCVVFQLVLIAREAMRPGDYWYTWICFVILGMIFALLTSALGGACISNFGKGLKPYVQRGAKKREMARIAELEKDANDNSWKIDED